MLNTPANLTPYLLHPRDSEMAEVAFMDSQHSEQKMGFGKKAGLVAIRLCLCCGVMAFGVCDISVLRAQTTQAQVAVGTQAGQAGVQSPAAADGQAAQTSAAPSFEVASIKQHVPDASGRMFISMGGLDVSRYSASNVTAKMLIDYAYGVKDFRVTGGPSWIGSERFDINAKVEDSLAEQLQKLPRIQQQAQMALMVKALLADRFKLKVTQTTKELPVFALTVAKGGPKLQETTAPDPQAPPVPPAGRGAPGVNGPPPPQPGGFFMWMGPNRQAAIEGNARPITDLVDMLSRQLSRQILDQTGLKGVYIFNLRFTPDAGLGGGPLPPGAESDTTVDLGGASIYTALQEQLGLKLESTKGPVETINIDSIEEPSDN
jgi:uncharacterized protein (TIGR03435 family)